MAVAHAPIAGVGPISSGGGVVFSTPVVRLVHCFRDSYSNAVATARSCYSPTLVTTDQVNKDEASRVRRDVLAADIYRAGHHTTLQHATFQFSLENVSRQFIWSFLHSHPYYNSEQVSQRYVAVGPDHLTVPSLPEQAEILFRETALVLFQGYQRLGAMLTPVVRREYQRLFPLRNPDEKPWVRAVQQRAQEVARYVLPVATQAHLYHTISGLTLHRYHRLCQSFDTPTEQKKVVEAMIQAVGAVDPLFVSRMEDPLSLDQTPEYQAHQEFHGKDTRHTENFIKEFDANLEGYSSKLVDYKVHGEKTMAQAVRSVLGVPRSALSDDDAIARVLSPAQNPYLSETLNLTAHSKLCRTMAHPHFTFARKISHTADSQDQRHRTVPGSRPVLAAHFNPNRPDYVTPSLLGENPEALDFYKTLMADLWNRIGRLMVLGASSEAALYLLPNAVSVRFEESGDLLNYHHKWTHRLCYTAQEEIWKTCQEEVAQVAQVAPRVAKHLGAPCRLRADARRRPFCPEGSRYCGVVVWKKDVKDYTRVL